MDDKKCFTCGEPIRTGEKYADVSGYGELHHVECMRLFTVAQRLEMFDVEIEIMEGEDDV